MQPVVQPPSQNQSCPSPSLVQCPSPSPSLIQQQHLIYAPITSLQPCPATLHPHCVYSGVQRNPGFSGAAASMTNQVPFRQTKGKWQPKSKSSRGHHHNPSHQQLCQPLQQQQIRQPLSYVPKPLVLFEQCTANQPPPGAPPSAPSRSSSFLVASSTFSHGPYGPGDTCYSASALALIPQPYYKPSDVPQAFCLLPEQHQTLQHHQLSAQNQGSYYNISAPNACSVQPINTKSTYQLTNVTNPYTNIGTFGNSQTTCGPSLPTSRIFQNPPVTLTLAMPPRDKLSIVSNVDFQPMDCSRNATLSKETNHQLAVCRAENNEWTVESATETPNSMFEVPNSRRGPKPPLSPIHSTQRSSSTFVKNQDDHYSDGSAASFDFTIEAEKMVSALCNTVSSNDLGRDETRIGNEPSTAFSGAAGDTVTNKTNIWFADFCADYGVSVDQNNRAVSTQTQEDRDESQQYPESMRKTIYWGCSEAESVLNSESYRESSRAEWLGNVSCATRTAVTKSSTCFPIFSGDRTFVQDLVNALLRISNGWLVLDNYLNKQQHYPNLNEKFDRELVNRFRNWEATTHDLLKEIVKTFMKIEENSGLNESIGFDPIRRQENSSNNSFPGDVSLYMNYDFFDSSRRHQETTAKLNNDRRTDRDSTYTLQYAPQSTPHPNFCSFDAAQHSQKETKLRSKWTITENLSSTIDGSKSISDIVSNHNDPEYATGNRFCVKNTSNAASTKINTSGRHSLNAEFVHLQNTVTESMGNCNESERQHWGVKEHQYDFVFGTSRAESSTASYSAMSDPNLKIRTAGNAYENAYTQRYGPRMDLTNLVNHNTTDGCTSVNGTVYLVSNAETAMDSTYVAADRNKTSTEPDYTSTPRIGQCGEYNCASGLVVSATSITSITPDPVYVGKPAANQRELAAVPRTKMTLLSQIEGNAVTTKDPKEMTANLSAWFASMRTTTGHRTINCPTEGRKNDNVTVSTRTSTHPQETSRSAMDLNRQLHMDGNRQLATLQNMQTIQSQPWNACNLLNNKRSNAKVHHVDEYDSSEDVRIYMKPGSYNVPRKRHHRKNTRRGENAGSSRGNNHTPRASTSRAAPGSFNFSNGKNHQGSSSSGSLMIVSSVQVSTTTTNTSTTIKVPFPASPIVPPPANFGLESSPRLLRRVRSFCNQQTRQDVAWKAACASAEILLEALNVKENTEVDGSESMSGSIVKESNDYRLSEIGTKTEEEIYKEEDYGGASSYEASEDDSDSTCKFSSRTGIETKSSESKQQRTNFKTDSWIIRTLNNASIISKIDTNESDDESTIGESLNSSIHEDRRRDQKVVTSTPEPPKIDTERTSADPKNVTRNLTDSFQETTNPQRPSEPKIHERSASYGREIVSASPIDTSYEFAGRATYSETVRRSTGKTCSSGKKENCRSRQTRSTGTNVPTTRSSVHPVPGRKPQRKDNDKTYQLLQKTRTTIGKGLSRDSEERDVEDSFANKKNYKGYGCSGSSARVFAAKTQVKKKEDNVACDELLESKCKTSDRGWSVWYSSRRRQSLTPLTLKKLTRIHQTVWQMDGAQILKYPSANLNAAGARIGSIEDYCRVIKNPVFLETIEYKLKNQIYDKAKQVIRDFRRIFNNSKLYYKNDVNCIAKIEILSKKIEDLFGENFSSWDFYNVADSLKDDNTSSEYKSSQHQKSIASRHSIAVKKNSATSIVKNEN